MRKRIYKVNYARREDKEMIENSSIAKAIMEVENAENLEQLKEGIVAVAKAIDREISWLNEDILEKIGEK